LDVGFHNPVAQSIKLNDQLDPFDQPFGRPIPEVLIHVYASTWPGKDLHGTLLVIDPGLGLTSAADTLLTLWHCLVIPLAAMCTIAQVAAGLDPALIVG